MRAASLALLTLALVGCSKRVENRVAGSDDARLAAYEARLEELSARGASGELSCEGRCDLASQTCEVAEEFCEVVERHSERVDLPPRCVRAREACAERTASCTRCR
jgi:hypothetical protein